MELFSQLINFLFGSREPLLIVNCGATLFETWICETICWRLSRLAFTSSLLFSTAFLTSFLTFTPRNSSSEKSGRTKRITQMINTVLIRLRHPIFQLQIYCSPNKLYLSLGEQYTKLFLLLFQSRAKAAFATASSLRSFFPRSSVIHTRFPPA